MNAMLAESDSHSAWLEPLFDIAFAAPGGATRLRQLILVLAMQGKLVSQRASETSASELLKQVAEERSALVKAGKIRAPKEANPIEDSEKPYAISKGWEWARLSEFSEYNGRGNIDPEKIEKHAWVLDLEDIEKGTSKLLYRATYAERSSKSTKSVFKAGDVLYGKLRPYLDKVIVADSDGVCTTEIVPIVPSKAVIPEFLCWLLKRPAFLAHVNSLMYGVKMPRLGTDDAISSIHPLPPLEEQRRIVARIGELMSRCEELESQRTAQETKRREARAAAVRQWLAGDDAAAALLGEHFATLVSTREDVTELRKAILQLGVMGKLVAQDPADTPTSELLKQIADEKAALVKAGRIRAPKALSPIADSEKPYAIPANWEWVRLGEIGIWKSGSTPSRTNRKYFGGNIPWVKSGEVKQGRITATEESITSLALEECPLHINPKGTVLVAMYGANIGEAGILDIEAATNQAVCACQTFSKLDKQFLLNLIFSMKPQLIAQGAGAAQPNISREKITATVVALPPLEEQKRIVSRIDALMRTCDTLEQSIDAAQVKQAELLDAVMARL